MLRELMVGHALSASLALLLVCFLTGCHWIYPYGGSPGADGKDATPPDHGPIDEGLDRSGAPDLALVDVSGMLTASKENSNCDPKDTRAPYGVCTITLPLTNTSDKTLGGLVFVVDTLEFGNVLIGADSGDGGVGSTLAVKAKLLGPDGLLSPREAFSQDFLIGCYSPDTFDFLVDILGRVVP